MNKYKISQVINITESFLYNQQYSSKKCTIISADKVATDAAYSLSNYEISSTIYSTCHYMTILKVKLMAGNKNKTRKFRLGYSKRCKNEILY